MNFENTTRRNFLKKTTALTVGISATTLFSGLAHAAIASGKCQSVLIGENGCTMISSILSKCDGGGCEGVSQGTSGTVIYCPEPGTSSTVSKFGPGRNDADPEEDGSFFCSY